MPVEHFLVLISISLEKTLADELEEHVLQFPPAELVQKEVQCCEHLLLQVFQFQIHELFVMLKARVAVRRDYFQVVEGIRPSTEKGKEEVEMQIDLFLGQFLFFVALSV